MELAIYTYGHIDAVFYILNGLSMLASGKFGEAITVAAASGSAAYYALRASYAGGGGYKVHVGKVIGMVAMLYFLLLPRADMVIYDHVSKKREKVDNLPLGFALPVGLLERFGDLLTGGFEQAFGVVGSSSYRDYGPLFGARLVKESKEWRIRSPEFTENMANFIDRCVIPEAMIGYRYSPEDLLKSGDIWDTVKSGASTLRQTTVRAAKGRIFMDCKRAASEVIEPAFKGEFEILGKKYAGTDMGEAGQSSFVPRLFERPNSNFKKNVEISFKNYLGIEENAERLIRQRMMIGALKDYSDSYGYARASATQESNWRIAGDLASVYLPILATVIKGLVYSSFVFMVPFLIIAGGLGRYLGYLSLVASLQLWAPMNAVLNMFIELYSSASLAGIADRIVSFSTSPQIGAYTDKIVAVASGLQASIPFLAFSMVRGGVGGFIQAAGSITGASSSAASQAANESVTGNKSFDNYSAGNRQLYNQGGFKTDWNSSYSAGESSYRHSDGSLEKVTGDGNILIQSGVGVTASSGSTAYRLEDSMRAEASEGTAAAESVHRQDLRSLSDAKSKHFAKTSDYISHLAQREHAGENFAYENMGEEGKYLRQAVSYAKRLHDEKGYDWKVSGSVSAEAAASGGIAFLGNGVTVGVRSGASAEKGKGGSVGEGTNIGIEDSVDQNRSNLEKAMSNSSWAKENSVDTGYSDAVRDSYEEQQRSERQESISRQKVDEWRKAQNVIESQGGSSSKDMYQEVVDGIKKEYGVDAYTAQKMADRNSPEAKMVWKELSNADGYVQKVLSDIRGGKEEVSGEKATRELNRFTDENNAKIDRDTQSDVRNHAINKGMDFDNLEKGINESRHDLKEKYQKITMKNAAGYQTVKNDNEAKASEKRRRIHDTIDETATPTIADKGILERSKNDKGKND